MHTNRSGAYTSNAFISYFKLKRIYDQMIVNYSPQKNKLVEHNIQIFLKRIKNIITNIKVLKYLREKLAKTINFI